MDNKNVIKKLWLTFFIVLIIYFALIIGVSLYFGEGSVLGLTVVISTVLLVSFAFYVVYKEVKIGYYVCSKCGNKFNPTYKEALLAMHLFSTRYLKCDKCGKRSWAKKVLNE